MLSNFTYDVFVWRRNRVNGKLWRENKNEIFFGVYLVGWGGRKINDRTQVFSPLAYQKVFSSKWRENLVGMNFFLIDKNAHLHVHIIIIIIIFLL